jgi:predicted DNA-binding transcriptional regulator AlpA
MATGLESALAEWLKDVLREVAADVIEDLQETISTNHRSFAPPDHKLLLPAPETAKRLAISERHLHGLTKSDQIPSVRIGSSVRYNIQTIRESPILLEIRH